MAYETGRGNSAAKRCVTRSAPLDSTASRYVKRVLACVGVGGSVRTSVFRRILAAIIGGASVSTGRKPRPPSALLKMCAQSSHAPRGTHTGCDPAPHECQAPAGSRKLQSRVGHGPGSCTATAMDANTADGARGGSGRYRVGGDGSVPGGGGARLPSLVNTLGRSAAPTPTARLWGAHTTPRCVNERTPLAAYILPVCGRRAADAVREAWRIGNCAAIEQGEDAHRCADGADSDRPRQLEAERRGGRGRVVGRDA